MEVNSPNELVIKPGFGSDSLHVGQTEREVRSILGAPERPPERHKDAYYLDYPSRGLQLDVGTRGGRLKHLFFFRAGVKGNQGANVATSQGIKPGDAWQKVLEALGEPTTQGSAAALSSGSRLGGWFSYADGVDFDFGEDGRVDMITITARQGSRRANSRRANLRPAGGQPRG